MFHLIGCLVFWQMAPRAEQLWLMAGKLGSAVVHACFDLKPMHQMKAGSTADHSEMQTRLTYIGDYLPCKSLILQANLCSTNIIHPPTVSPPSTAGSLCSL